MQDTGYRAIAIVGVGAVMPDAPNVPEFWKNVTAGRYSITEVTPDRWDSALYYDPDHSAPDKTYSKIGGWVREYAWDPLKWRMAIPPRVADAMDASQQWAITATREALADYGYPGRPLDTERTAVIIGNAMGGEKHYLTALRAHFPEYARELEESATFAALPDAVRREITREWHTRLGKRLPPITEDSMPGELANCLAGRIANVFNFHGPSFTCDAACASAMAATTAAVEGLIENDCDVAITGGIDRNMGASTFVKFCKIGALSATGSRPYAEGADGFVMGEGTALFILKRLADAERDGDKIYAVIRGIGASSDGKGKGITAAEDRQSAEELGSDLLVDEGDDAAAQAAVPVETISSTSLVEDPPSQPGLPPVDEVPPFGPFALSPSVPPAPNASPIASPPVEPGASALQGSDRPRASPRAPPSRTPPRRLRSCFRRPKRSLSAFPRMSWRLRLPSRCHSSSCPWRDVPGSLLRPSSAASRRSPSPTAVWRSRSSGCTPGPPPAGRLPSRRPPPAP